ncbi:hypothetical protein [Lysinibacillus sp. G4S2]|uniref:hypothetical protein n=1 Tax=Lysinibacillus sp. G4S2 TaxID=3055859 RepID=UPI0025A286E7|nr:hypothetical protein [Lysinibacillus sp. G4S2]MDM5250027.1 hypothetical protein [Lysinibacillus sp. G4S2]
MLEFLIKEDFGFKEEEIEGIGKHFILSLDYDDWGSIELIEVIDLDEKDIEDSENHLKLSTGRMAYFPDDLLEKELKAQID